ncbi:phosphofurin acidic cluster sorting protein 2-like [Platysternon megacephalum]|uniref:Ferritin n=1 Tax=Platysternon megacephalum TaxID=55544 RepID=A0A4D9DPT5_9SAUR|nr:phosphofurin acidic cluster sorting protein 2-like [Platysternon megacephalum]
MANDDEKLINNGLLGWCSCFSSLGYPEVLADPLQYNLIGSETESQAWWNFCVDCEADAILMENLELYVGYVYLSMSYYFDSHEVALRPTAQFVKKQSHEQGEHAEKFLKYQNKQLCCKPSRSQSRVSGGREWKPFTGHCSWRRLGTGPATGPPPCLNIWMSK